MAGMNKHLLKINKKRFDKLNITKWQNEGITGKGVKIAVIGESKNAHHAGSWLIEQVATDTEIITLDTTMGKDRVGWDDALQYCLDEDADIVCVSYQIYSVSENFKELSQKLHDKGCILLCASHNDGREIRDYPVTLGSWYATGAYDGKSRAYYSNYGDRLLCLGYTDYFNKNYKGDYIPISHTSGTPQVIAGMVALLKELRPNLTIAEFEQFVKDSSMRITTDDWNKFEGWGLMKLPNIIPRKGENMDFKDVGENRWSKEDIDLVNRCKVMKGYKDGTFRPGENITREEVASVAANLIRMFERGVRK